MSLVTQKKTRTLTSLGMACLCLWDAPFLPDLLITVYLWGVGEAKQTPHIARMPKLMNTKQAWHCLSLSLFHTISPFLLHCLSLVFLWAVY